jgi:Carboxypeptidase regulatory-like domain/TonB-dependent Receptor Plug Domain
MPNIQLRREKKSEFSQTANLPMLRQRTKMIPVQNLLLFLVLITSPQTASVRGRVLDSRTLEPIEKATVSIRDRRIETRTTANGEFELSEVPPGEIELYVTTVGYALIRKKLDVALSTPVEVEILLGPDVIRRTDEITVTEKPFVSPEPAAVSDHLLTQADMRNLASVLIDDPLRSVQALPGVTTGDDFYAQFSARGAGFRSIGYATDGILLYAPMYEVGDINDGASISMLNGDVIDSLTLSTGGFSAKYGDRTAGYLHITTRDGNRQRFTNTGTASASGVGWTSEGPIGKSRKASWLFSARKSYLDWLVHKVSSDTSSFIFGFKDFFAKVTFEPVVRHQLRLSGNFGLSRVDQQQDKQFGPNDFLFGDSRNTITTGTWLWILSNRLTLDSAVSYDRAVLKNINHDRQLLYRSSPRQFAFKQDAVYHFTSSNKVEGGYSARHLAQDGERRHFQFATRQFVTTDSISASSFASSWQPGAYAQNTITGANSRVAFTYGARFDRLSLTGQNVWMPRAGVSFSPLENTRLALAFGHYAQFPGFFQMFGEFGNLHLRAERATHYIFQVEQLLNEKTRVRFEAYDREDRNDIYSADTEYRLLNGQPIGPRLGITGGRYQNNLRGHARGIELFVERHSVNKLSGWISYSYGVARYRDAATNLSFDGDFDQRHTLNLYGTYRLKPTLNVSSKYRYGSNIPLPAFLLVQGESTTLSSQRNQSRPPAYSRLDVRANKAFHFDRWKLTLYGEVLNILGHKNIRYTRDVDTVNRTLSFDKDTMFPVLPIAGLRVEF